MTPYKHSLKEFFEGEKEFSIPVYQRAYSWEKSQWQVFLEDLEEATKGENHYFFGNVLLEKTEDGKFEVIDGQQRLTTIVIFMRALINVLNNETARLEEWYLIQQNKPKLNAVEYDRDYFYDVIIRNDDNTHKPQTPSQKRIKGAKEFFTKELKAQKTERLAKILDALEEAEMLQIVFANKKDSVLMFELQNNRGKELTNMEKLKSYLAYQIYTYADKEGAEYRLKRVAEIFKEIYRVLNDIRILDEDAILQYFNMAKYGFGYRENDDTLSYKSKLKKIEDAEKLDWIDSYVKELKDAFMDFKTFENLKSEYKDYLIDLKVWEIYPFVIKAYTLFRNDTAKLERVFKALEVIAFRDKLVKTRADLASRLNQVLKNFTSVEKLEEGIKEICSGYWGNRAISDAIRPKEYSLGRIAPYIFMRYENSLLTQNTKTKGYGFTLDQIKNPQIEHIAPQTENKQGGQASGYCEYDQEFKERYLHYIGNLMLIDQAHNVVIGNKPFKDKLDSYNNSPMQQHKEINDFASDGRWDKDSIGRRYRKLEKFILDTWSLKD
ncbi:hypothetical protein BBW65_03280 [Helicobacter enhydrae]|uniref:DUF262 domain-containing protein n=1 Tax=Helicobacter enhydrae TaxID=222136 RepID=A0A1B1U551_9HELI|nr:DUF262 domain-containing protein [Helicobacter enhydrae]ANV97880.1 hypothetical protein BBW65_03280 [Helicobacter enhydrae]